MRPDCCTTSTVPSTLENIRFFFRQEWRDRAIHGKRRFNRLRHSIKGCAPKLFKGGKFDDFYHIREEKQGKTYKSLVPPNQEVAGAPDTPRSPTPTPATGQSEQKSWVEEPRPSAV